MLYGFPNILGLGLNTQGKRHLYCSSFLNRSDKRFSIFNFFIQPNGARKYKIQMRSPDDQSQSGQSTIPKQQQEQDQPDDSPTNDAPPQPEQQEKPACKCPTMKNHKTFCITCVVIGVVASFLATGALLFFRAFCPDERLPNCGRHGSTEFKFPNDSTPYFQDNSTINGKIIFEIVFLLCSLIHWVIDGKRNFVRVCAGFKNYVLFH